MILADQIAERAFKGIVWPFYDNYNPKNPFKTIFVIFLQP